MRTRHYSPTAGGVPSRMQESDEVRATNEPKAHPSTTFSGQRLQAVICAIAAHLCIGGIYTFSLFTEAISRNLGVVVQSKQDWNVSSIIPVFSLTITVAGLTAAFSGSWAERVGPNRPIVLAGLFWGGGLLICSLGLAMHSLLVVYLGYGLLGGFGIGLAYAPPVAGLIRWFPDRKGFASGLAIMGFGGGALLASPLIRRLMELFYVPPQPCDAEFKGCFKDGTGSTGAKETLAILGFIYLAVLGLAGYFFIPAPQSISVTASETTKQSIFLPTQASYVKAPIAFRTKQFLQVWIALFVNASAGMALLGVAKNVLTDVFPQAFSPTFPSTYVAMLSLSNGFGRIMFARLSDQIGKKSTFSLLLAITAAVYLLMPILFSKGDSFALNCFVGLSLLAVAVYGGGFAVAPAYLAELFGSQQVGAIYSRLLTSWAAAGLFGPTVLAVLRRREEERAMREIAENLSQIALNGNDPLIDAQLMLGEDVVMTIDSLMKLIPQDEAIVMRPRAHLYDSTMYVMVALVLVGLVVNLSVRPVAEQFIENDKTLSVKGEVEMQEENDSLLVRS